MAIPYVLSQVRGVAVLGGGGGNWWSRTTLSTASTIFTITQGHRNLRVPASKKSRFVSTSELDKGSESLRKGTLIAKSVPGYQIRGRGACGSHVSKTKEGFMSPIVETEFDFVAAFPGPKPPAGFILDRDGAVVLVTPTVHRVVTVVDPSSQRPLECMIRRAFQSSDGRDCLLLLPLDMPLQILKIDEEREGLTELSDEELQEILPSAVYALAKRRLHLIVSGFCLTARGGFCYTEEHVLDFKAEYGEGLGGSLTEGVEIASFQVGNFDYIVYTPFDPIMFVVHTDEATGQLRIADDGLLEDDIVLEAIDEENDFQALVDEEDALHETMREAK